MGVFLGKVSEGIENLESVLNNLGNGFIYIENDAYYKGTELYKVDFIPFSLYHIANKYDIEIDINKLSKNKKSLSKIKPTFSLKEYCNDEDLQISVDNLLSLGKNIVFLLYNKDNSKFTIGHLDRELIGYLYSVIDLKTSIFYEEMADYMNFTLVDKLENELKIATDSFTKRYGRGLDFINVSIDKLTPVMNFMYDLINS